MDEQFQIPTRRMESFLEIELKLYKVTKTWLKDNLDDYDFFLNEFVSEEEYEQANLMTKKSEYEPHLYFLNINKLNGNPLVIQNKRFYSIEDLIGICQKVDFNTEEAKEYCIENYKQKCEIKS